MQYGMIIDLDRCVGCHACVIACKAEWEIPTQFDRNWVHRLGPARTSSGMAATYYPGLCNHCENPPCVPVCPADPVRMIFKDAQSGETLTMEVAATWKDPFNGTVQVDRDRCIGCGACRDACPYNARFIDESLADDTCLGKVDKCSYCMPRVAQGLEPACVQTCPAGARIFGNLDDPDSEVSRYVKKGAVGLTSTAVQTGPHTMYYGGKKGDMELLMQAAPQKMPKVSLRRGLMTRMALAARNRIKEIGLLGLAGGLLSRSLREDDD
ncbi:4Fe-4S dicluster domain-containing protein [Desulfobulbus propionicus]|jgi:tetrathionate reductase subunit B